MISENQFLIGYLSPKLFNHLGINEIYQDPRQNFSLIISHNSIPRPFINSPYTLTFTNAGFHDCFAKHLSKVWFHLVHYRQSKHFLQLHTIHTTKKCAGIHLDHIMVYISHHIELNSNSDVQFLAHFWEIPCNLLLSPNWFEVQLIILELTAKLKSGPNFKRHAKILHHSLWQPGRQMPFLVEISPSYQASLKMALFKASYGQRCQTPLSLSQTEDH